MSMRPSLDCPARVASLYVLQLKVYRRSPRIWIKFGDCPSKLVSEDVNFLNVFLAQMRAVLGQHPENAFDLGSFHQSLSLITIGREDFFPVPSGNVHQIFQSLAPATEDSFENFT
jgi:hypothetical protein